MHREISEMLNFPSALNSLECLDMHVEAHLHAKFQKAYGISHAYLITLKTLFMSLYCNVARFIAYSFA